MQRLPAILGRLFAALIAAAVIYRCIRLHDRVGTWELAAIRAFPLIVLVKIYQFTLSPIMGRQCRYHPTCSWYALEALRTHGGFTGALLAAKRIARCHPFAKGGNDPVPHKE